MEKALWYITAASALCTVSSLMERRYYFVSESKNWTEAQSYCRETYTDLVTVDNPDIITILNKMVELKKDSSTSAWIGLYYDVISWKWMSANESEELNFKNWDVGQPSNLLYKPGCGLISGSGKWYDTYCEFLNEPVCSDVTGEHVEFVFVSKAMTWTDAQSYCREHYTDLAVPRNQSENEKIREVIPAGVYSWISVYAESWRWSDGSMFVFHHWAAGQPNRETEKCGAMIFSLSGRWGDWPCDSVQPFICHHDVVPFTKQVVKVKLVGNSALDLTDPRVLENLKEELQRKVKEQGVAAGVKLSWQKQLDGKIFYKEKNEEDQN